MVSFRKLLSLRNGLRLSGILGLAVGAPLAVCPALGVLIFFGKRESSDADERALNLAVSYNGMAIVSTSLAALLAKPSHCSLLTATVTEVLFALYHLGSRFGGEWERAKGRMAANKICARTTCLVLAAQVYALGWGDKGEDE